MVARHASRYRRAIDTRALCRDEAGRVLLLADADGEPVLPGGPIEHGEHPDEAVARWSAEQTLAVPTVRAALRVVTDVRRDRRGRWAGSWLHRDTIVYGVQLAGVRPSGDWVDEEEIGRRPMPVATAAALGLPVGASGAGRAPRRVSWAAVPSQDGRRQRFAVYGYATDPTGNVLLTRVAPGFPGAGRWHLPGGGTDFGESAEAGLRREIAEETAQRALVGALLAVSDRHQTRGVDGRAVDWHGVRAVYAVRIPEPTRLRVTERHGSTELAAWFTLAQALELPLTEVALEALTTARPVGSDTESS